VVTWSHYDLHVVGQHDVPCEVSLSGEDLSRYSNKIESVGLRKCRITNLILLINTSQSVPQIMAERTAGTCGTVTLRRLYDG